MTDPVSSLKPKKEIYKMDVLLWERAGKPTNLCTGCNKTVLRVGLDTCCSDEEES